MNFVESSQHGSVAELAPVVDLETLRDAIFLEHRAVAIHVGSVSVGHATMAAEISRAMVEVFCLQGHSKAAVCYAWTVDMPSQEQRIVTMLGLPPINSAVAAVHAARLR